MRKNYEEISLQSDVFEAARKDFDRLLQKLFRTMENNESKEGSITLKVNVQTEKTPARDEHGVYFEAHKPTIEHVITTTVPLKDKANGKKNTGMNLVWDGELGRYILRYVPEEGQRSMFDDDFEENLKNDHLESQKRHRNCQIITEQLTQISARSRTTMIMSTKSRRRKA